MKNIPRKKCSFCLPDFDGSIFEAKVTSAAFQNCDHTNTGASPFCDLETRQKGLQSNSGPVPICFCLLASRRIDKVIWLPEIHNNNSYIGELLTAADRCKNENK